MRRASQAYAGGLGAAVVAAALLCAGGCGYNQSGSDRNRLEGGYKWNSLYREDVQTVAVPVFRNNDFRRGLEIRLTEAVIKQIEMRAPYKVVPRSRADTILEGEITSVSMATLARDYQTNLPRQQQMVITLDFTWKDLRTGRILVQRRRFEHHAVFHPSLGEGEYVGSQEAIERCALAIVQEMQADW